MKYLELLVKLRKIFRSINLESKRIEKRFGISIPQLLVLQYLSEQEDSKASAKEIKKHINLNASTVSGILSRLEDKGLVARLPKPNDRRVSYVILSIKGMDLLKESPTTLQEKISQKLTNLTPSQIEGMDKNIDLLIQIMDLEDENTESFQNVAKITGNAVI